MLDAMSNFEHFLSHALLPQTWQPSVKCLVFSSFHYKNATVALWLWIMKCFQFNSPPQTFRTRICHTSAPAPLFPPIPVCCDLYDKIKSHKRVTMSNGFLKFPSAACWCSRCLKGSKADGNLFSRAISLLSLVWRERWLPTLKREFFRCFANYLHVRH